MSVNNGELPWQKMKDEDVEHADGEHAAQQDLPGNDNLDHILREARPEKEQGGNQSHVSFAPSASLKSGQDHPSHLSSDQDRRTHSHLSSLRSHARSIRQGMSSSVISVAVNSILPASESGDDFREKHGTVLSSTISLTVTTMGVGVLALPHAFAQTGLVFGVLMVVGISMLSDMSLCCIIKAARAAERDTFEGVAEFYLGITGKRVLNYALIFLLFGLLVSVFDIAIGSFPGLIQHAANCTTDSCTYKKFITPMSTGLVAAAIIFPALAQKSLHKLRYASVLALCGECFGVTMLVIVFAQSGGAVHPSVSALGSFSGCALGVGIMFTAFLAQFNVVKIESEMMQDKRDKMPMVIHRTIFLIVMPIYILAGVVGYLMVGAGVSDNVFNDINSMDIMVARLAVTMTSLAKLPLCFVQLRDSVQTESGMEGYHYLLTFTIAATGFLVAYLLQSLSKALDISGATAAALVGFIFPGLLFVCYLKTFCRTLPLLASDTVPSVVERLSPNWYKTRYAQGVGMMAFGSLAGLICLINIIIHWDSA